MKDAKLMKLPDLDKLAIVHYPDPILKKTCTPVTAFGPDIKALADRMLTLMKEGRGVGLAAPQVGLSLRLFVCNPTGEPEDDMVCVNPEFVELNGAEEKEEGCLSLPGLGVNMRRATRAVMRFCDADGQVREQEGEDLLARIWQHESDHLDGRLITDNMSATDEISNRRAIKQLEADYETPRRRGQKSRCASSS
jgi:peptide deformylase